MKAGVTSSVIVVARLGTGADTYGDDGGHTNRDRHLCLRRTLPTGKSAYFSNTVNGCSRTRGRARVTAPAPAPHLRCSRRSTRRIRYSAQHQAEEWPLKDRSLTRGIVSCSPGCRCLCLT